MVTMSQKEFQRVKVIENAAGERLSIRDASRLLQLSERQVQRLKRRYRPDSMSWVQDGNRGRAMPWAISRGGKICSEIQAAAPVYRVYLAATSEFPSELIKALRCKGGLRLRDCWALRSSCFAPDDR
jgi:hypothetical protein